MILVKKILLGILAAVIGLLGWWYVERPFEVSRIVDGDNIELKDGRRIRYIGVDTPEEGECFRDESTKMNHDLVMGKKVRLKFDADTKDDYGRWLAYVYVDGVMVNGELLRRGAGEYFFDEDTVKHMAELVEKSQKAYEEKQGLWGKCAEDKKVGCVIKGNISRLDKRWYHLPSFRHYSQTKVNLDQGDRWFCTEDQAIKAGFKAARE